MGSPSSWCFQFLYRKKRRGCSLESDIRTHFCSSDCYTYNSLYRYINQKYLSLTNTHETNKLFCFSSVSSVILCEILLSVSISVNLRLLIQSSKRKIPFFKNLYTCFNHGRGEKYTAGIFYFL